MQRGNEATDGTDSKSVEGKVQSQAMAVSSVQELTSVQHTMPAPSTSLAAQASRQQAQVVAGMSGVCLPASQSLQALSLGQALAPPSAQHVSSGACPSLQGPRGISTLIQVSGSSNKPVLGSGATGVVQRLYVPVSGHQIGGGMVVVPPTFSSDRAGSSLTGGTGGTLLLSSPSTSERIGKLQVKHARQVSPRQHNQPAASVAIGGTQQLTVQQGLTTTGRSLVTQASASGRTIHHHGQSPTKGGIPPLVTNPAQHPSNPAMSNMNVNQQMKQLTPQQQQQLQAAAQAVLNQGAQQGVLGAALQVQVPTPSTQQIARRLSGNVNPGSASSTPKQIDRTSPLLSQFSALLPQRTSPKQSPDRPRKKIKLEEKPAPNEETAHYRQLICDEKLREMSGVKESYSEHLTELYFLQCGLNLMDYHTWKKKPPPQLVQVFKSGQLDSDDEELGHEKKINDEVKVITTSGGTTPLATPVAISTQLPAAVTAMQQQQQQQQEKRLGGRHGMVFGHVQLASQQVSPGASPVVQTVKTEPGLNTSVQSNQLNSSLENVSTPKAIDLQSSATQQTSVVATPSSSQLAKIMSSSSTTQPKLNSSNPTNSSTPALAAAATIKIKQPLSPGKSVRPPSISAVYEAAVGSQEAIVERAKQEAQVMQRVAELRKDGMWSARRLPKVSEPSRQRAHWDYLLEEMQWLAADFAQERKWKKAGARKIARMISRYHADIHQREIKAEKEEGQKLKKIASQMSKMVKEFWSNVEKVVEYKQQSRLEEKRKKALDMHLNFIVDQTEKYSSWLTEGLSAQSVASSTSRPPSLVDDGEFRPELDESDDEETIEKEEEQGVDEASQKAEIDALQKESEMPIEELLKNLPAEILEKPASVENRPDGESGDDADDEADEKGDSKKDEDFEAAEDSEDEEETIAEQEKKEKSDYKAEINELQAEGEMSMEELVAKYAGAYDSDFEPETSEQSTEEETDDSSDDEESEEDVDEVEKVGVDEEGLGLESLMQEQQTQTEDGTTSKHDLTDIAAAAQSLQPTGFTLETTQVRTTVPFILKHTLREYQHVGLDWMATMYDRKLNGILADEMGLGKTIQTIAVLSHLAIEHQVWGPHLIVVPTSVMLNWEMEFKKWAPAFKILTYYGNQKERKQKRTGWTKTNAFHVCITSYKLVIQDHQAFRRKKWRYFILDEAQNIKNFKSQRWQTLLNFQSQRRLLLTGTPLQNSLMELWSLMHFLMPHVFASHREFKEWFSNPMTGMIEGSREYNEDLIKRLHKVLRPFLLRRLKADVEKQMPQKYEHVVMCRLSKRQRYLYDDFMSQTKTKETLATGHFMSVINILMQLRKVCNHPNLFDPRPIVSPFQMEGITYTTASVVLRALERDPFNTVNLEEMFPCMADLELKLPAYAAHRVRKLQTSQPLIEEIDSQPEPPPRPKALPLNKPFVYRSHSPMPPLSGRSSPYISVNQQASPANKSRSSTPTPAVVSAGSSVTSTSASTGQQAAQPITLQIHHTQQGPRFMIPSGQLSQLTGGMIQIVQTASGQHILAPVSSASSIINGPNTTTKTTVLTNGAPSATKTSSATLQLPESSAVTTGKPVMRVSPVTQVQQTSEKADVKHSDSHTTMETRRSSRVQSDNKLKVMERSQLYSEELAIKRAGMRKELLSRISKSNKRKCTIRPLYGADLCQTVDVMSDKNAVKNDDRARWKGLGYVTCQCVHRVQNNNHPNVYWRSTQHLSDLIHTPESYLEELQDIINRFVFVVPVVTAPRIQMHMSHPPPSIVQEQRYREFRLTKALGPKSCGLHPISSRMMVQFPELRLIQYDCGKLQTLDTLLRKLKSGDHRVLIFTQMTKMLDVLEAFLNFHGHRYLRLDGTTRVEQRQILMDRFNQDKRIFCFILSTRSGGIGVNLTGADTVVFYDSDWNPTMDAQAQDRCHRIGQTRDVHIYRLISEMTIEENILKKANQKRLMSDVAIEGGNFTTAFFKQQTIKDLFEEPSGLKELAEEEEAQKEKLRELRRRQDKKKDENSDDKLDTSMSQEQIEQALCAAEDETDVQAAKIVAAEQQAEMAEFDENIPWDEKESEAKKERDEATSRVEQELAMIQKELTPVERYAVMFMETQMAPFTTEELQKAEEEVSIAKEEWELSRLQALKEEEERRAEFEEDEMLYTYTRDDANNQVKKKNKRQGGSPVSALSLAKRIQSRAAAYAASQDVYTDDIVPGRGGKSKSRRSGVGVVNADKHANVRVENAEIPVGRIRQGDVKVEEFKQNTELKKSQLGSPKTSSVKSKQPGSSPNKNLSPAVQPWSNPNLVIRTRRASAKVGESDSDVDVTSVANQREHSPVPTSVVTPSKIKQRERENIFAALSPAKAVGSAEGSTASTVPILEKMAAQLGGINPKTGLPTPTTQIVILRNAQGQTMYTSPAAAAALLRSQGSQFVQTSQSSPAVSATTASTSASASPRTQNPAQALLQGSTLVRNQQGQTLLVPRHLLPGVLQSQGKTLVNAQGQPIVAASGTQVRLAAAKGSPPSAATTARPAMLAQGLQGLQTKLNPTLLQQTVRHVSTTGVVTAGSTTKPTLIQVPGIATGATIALQPGQLITAEQLQRLQQTTNRPRLATATPRHVTPTQILRPKASGQTVVTNTGQALIQRLTAGTQILQKSPSAGHPTIVSLQNLTAGTPVSKLLQIQQSQKQTSTALPINILTPSATSTPMAVQQIQRTQVGIVDGSSPIVPSDDESSTRKPISPSGGNIFEKMSVFSPTRTGAATISSQPSPRKHLGNIFEQLGRPASATVTKLSPKASVSGLSSVISMVRGTAGAKGASSGDPLVVTGNVQNVLHIPEQLHVDIPSPGSIPRNPNDSTETIGYGESDDEHISINSDSDDEIDTKKKPIHVPEFREQLQQILQLKPQLLKIQSPKCSNAQTVVISQPTSTLKSPSVQTQVGAGQKTVIISQPTSTTTFTSKPQQSLAQVILASNTTSSVTQSVITVKPATAGATAGVQYIRIPNASSLVQGQIPMGKSVPPVNPQVKVLQVLKQNLDQPFSQKLTEAGGQGNVQVTSPTATVHPGASSAGGSTGKNNVDRSGPGSTGQQDVSEIDTVLVNATFDPAEPPAITQTSTPGSGVSSFAGFQDQFAKFASKDKSTAKVTTGSVGKASVPFAFVQNKNPRVLSKVFPPPASSTVTMQSILIAPPKDLSRADISGTGSTKPVVPHKLIVQPQVPPQRIVAVPKTESIPVELTQGKVSMVSTNPPVANVQAPVENQQLLDTGDLPIDDDVIQALMSLQAPEQQSSIQTMQSIEHCPPSETNPVRSSSVHKIKSLVSTEPSDSGSIVAVVSETAEVNKNQNAGTEVKKSDNVTEAAADNDESQTVNGEPQKVMDSGAQEELPAGSKGMLNGTESTVENSEATTETKVLDSSEPIIEINTPFEDGNAESNTPSEDKQTVIEGITTSEDNISTLEKNPIKENAEPREEERDSKETESDIRSDENPNNDAKLNVESTEVIKSPPRTRSCSRSQSVNSADSETEERVQMDPVQGPAKILTDDQVRPGVLPCEMSFKRKAAMPSRRRSQSGRDSSTESLTHSDGARVDGNMKRSTARKTRGISVDSDNVNPDTVVLKESNNDEKENERTQGDNKAPGKRRKSISTDRDQDVAPTRSSRTTSRVGSGVDSNCAKEDKANVGSRIIGRRSSQRLTSAPVSVARVKSNTIRKSVDEPKSEVKKQETSKVDTIQLVDSLHQSDESESDDEISFKPKAKLNTEEMRARNHDIDLPLMPVSPTQLKPNSPVSAERKGIFEQMTDTSVVVPFKKKSWRDEMDLESGHIVPTRDKVAYISPSRAAATNKPINSRSPPSLKTRHPSGSALSKSKIMKPTPPVRPAKPSTPKIQSISTAAKGAPIKRGRSSIAESEQEESIKTRSRASPVPTKRGRHSTGTMASKEEPKKTSRGGSTSGARGKNTTQPTKSKANATKRHTRSNSNR